MEIYKNYAYSGYEREAVENNWEILNTLKQKYKIKTQYLNSMQSFRDYKIDTTDYDLVALYQTNDRYTEYYIVKCPEELSDDEIALIISDSGLHFGYYGEKPNYKFYHD